VLRHLLLAALAAFLSAQGLVSAWASPVDREWVRMRGRSDAALEKLNLSPEKKAKYLRIRTARRAATEAVKSDLHAERMRLRALYSDYRLNTSAANAAIKRVNKFQLDLLNNSLQRTDRDAKGVERRSVG